MNELVVAGAGVGSLSDEVRDAVSKADIICASERFRNLVPEGKRYIPLRNIDAALDAIANESGRAVILVSGDPGVYSLLPLVKRRFQNVRVLPGVSSLQVLCAYAGESWSDAVILSGHGRVLNVGRFLNLVERNRLVILFCDRHNSPQWACEKLAEISTPLFPPLSWGTASSPAKGRPEGVYCVSSGVNVVIGENLGSDSERILSGNPEDFANHESPELSLMLVRNSSPFVPVNTHPRDSEFVRAEGVVMTSESVRAVILARLNMRRDSVLWDIGAGTGSISVCAGLESPESEIHAVECRPEAVKVIAQNAAKFHLHSIAIHEGRALDVVSKLPVPSHVFIGGSGGELAGILEHIAGLRESVKVVAACVTLETFTAAHTIMKDWRDFEALQVSVSESKSVSELSTLMKPRCPVVILSALSEQKFSACKKFTR